MGSAFFLKENFSRFGTVRYVRKQKNAFQSVSRSFANSYIQIHTDAVPKSPLPSSRSFSAPDHSVREFVIRKQFMECAESELRRAVADLRLLKLNEAAHWAATQLRGMGRRARSRRQDLDEDGDPDRRRRRQSLARELDEAPVDEADTYFFASTSFDAREYSAAVHALEPYKTGASSPSTFLYFYARYLKLQKLKVNKQKSAMKNNAFMAESELGELRGELERIDRDAFLSYVLGLTLMDQSNLPEARRVLVESVRRYPCNWSAWKALAASCPDISSFKYVLCCLGRFPAAAGSNARAAPRDDTFPPSLAHSLFRYTYHHHQGSTAGVAGSLHGALFPSARPRGPAARRRGARGESLAGVGLSGESGGHRDTGSRVQLQEELRSVS